jgi:NAD(P)-dependent dehydrogenase (short-subunit alcohol dehydrogenase family)
MVQLQDVRIANTALVQNHQPLVAVFFGGTSGIGHYTLRSLCNTTSKEGGKGFRAYIIGRKASAAEEIIAECQAIYSQAEILFIQAKDLSLISEVDKACAEVVRLEQEKGAQEARIDYLMLSTGGSIFLPRKETVEGIDVTMALMYYSRMRIITKLLPLLLKSTLPPTVVSVYAAGTEAKLYPEDLSLRDLKRYSYTQARSHMVYMHTLFMETLAEQHRGKLVFVHIFPGLVPGPTFQSPELPRLFRLFWRWIFVPLFGWFAFLNPDECGERMLSLASPLYPPRPVVGSAAQEGAMQGTDGALGSGVYSLSWNGQDNLPAKTYQKFDKEEMKAKVWAHTMRAFEVTEKGEVFTE